MKKQKFIKHIFNFLFLALLTFGNLRAHSGAYIELNRNVESRNIGHHLEILEDPSKKLTIKDILKPENQLKFQVSNNESPNLGMDSSAYWVRFTIKDLDGAEKWVLSYDFSTQDELWFYQRENCFFYLIKLERS